MSFEMLHQNPLRAGDDALERSERQAQYLGRLTMRIALAEAEHRRGPLPRAEPVQSPLDVEPDVAALGSEVGHVGDLRRFFGALAPARQELPPGDPEQPAFVASLAVIGRGHSLRFEEGLLGEVVGAFAACDPGEEGANAPLVAAYERGEGGDVTRRRPPREVDVRSVAQPSAPARRR